MLNQHYFLYDVLDEKPDIGILKKRLSKIEPVKGKKGIKPMTLGEFISKIEMHVKQLTFDHVSSELKDYLNQEELIGLDKKIKITIKNLISDLRSNENESDY